MTFKILSSVAVTSLTGVKLLHCRVTDPKLDSDSSDYEVSFSRSYLTLTKGAAWIFLPSTDSGMSYPPLCRMSQSCISLIPSSCWIWWQSWRSRTCPWFRTLRGWRRLWSSSNSPWKQPRRISKHVTWLCYITQWLNLFLLAASELL